jgi:hypothetical protein
VVTDSINVDLPLHKRSSLTLAEAREKARIGRELAKAGISPSAYWRQEEERPAVTFEQAARARHVEIRKGWRNGKHGDQWLTTLETYAFPELGSKPVEDIDASAIQKVLLPIWLSKVETARRVKQRIGVVLDYSHAQGWRTTEAPMRAVNQLMRPIKQAKKSNFAAMPYADVPAFVAKLRAGDFSTRPCQRRRSGRHCSHCKRGAGLMENHAFNAMQSQDAADTRTGARDETYIEENRRCGAKTRSGLPCASYALPDGRCRMHGGTNPGAPLGNTNAMKHGLRSAETRRLYALLRSMQSDRAELPF